MNEPPPAPQGQGRLLGGRYRLGPWLRRSGLGSTWQAQEETLGRLVAVQEVRWRPPGELTGERATALYQRALENARAAARLDHPGVVPVHDVLLEDDRLWIITRLVHGRSLEEILDFQGPLTPRRAAGIGRDVLAALGCAHAAGVIHGDVKPCSILIIDDGRTVVTDFGLIPGWMEPVLTLGCVPYLPPERAWSERAVAVSDLWGLGATLYAAVEGRYRAHDAILTAARSGRVPPSPRAGPLEPVLEGLLARDPADRMTAATALPLLAQIADAAEVIDPEALYRAYAEPLRRYVRCLVADRGLSEALVDTDGVVQETFLRLLNATEPIRNPTAWLFVVARNQVSRAAAHQHRASGNDPAGHLGTGAARWSSLAPRPSLEDTLTARAVMDAIAGLPNKQRIAAYLHHVQGWSHAEIAEYLDCAASTARVNAHLGTKRLRDVVPRCDGAMPSVRHTVPTPVPTPVPVPARLRSLRDLLRRTLTRPLRGRAGWRRVLAGSFLAFSCFLLTLAVRDWSEVGFRTQGLPPDPYAVDAVAVALLAVVIPMIAEACAFVWRAAARRARRR